MKRWLQLLAVYVVVHTSYTSILDEHKSLVYDDWSISDGTNTWTNCFNADGCADLAEALNAAHKKLHSDVRESEKTK